MDDVLQHARELYAAGDIRRALEAAQVAAERAPRSPVAWRLLGQVSRHAGMPRASDDAFRRAAELSRRHQVPVRLSPGEFKRLVDGVVSSLSPDARRRLSGLEIRFADLPTEAEIRSGVRPDAPSHRWRRPEDVLKLYQANLENRAADEPALRGLVERSLSRT